MDYLKQTDQPLFPKILWNRPLRSSGAGRLLLPGGHPGHFSVIQAVYQIAKAAGIGQCTLALPDSLRALLAEIPDSRFLPSTPAGSLGNGALGELLRMAGDSDALALGADLSNSSETSILAEALVTRSAEARVVAFGDAFTSMKHNLKALIDRPNTLIVATMPQIFVLSEAAGVPIRIKSGDVTNKIEIMQELAQASKADYALVSRELIVAAEGKISLTTSVSAMDFFLPAAIGLTSVFWIQNPSKPFEALTAGAYALRQARETVAQSDNEVLLVGGLVKAIDNTLRQDDF